jgi:hypothetical protein
MREPVAPLKAWHDGDGAVSGLLEVPAAACASLSVDVWPQTQPKVVVRVPVPIGLSAGARFTAQLVQPPPLLPLNGALTRQTHGAFHYEFPSEPWDGWARSRLGVDVVAHRRELIVADVRPMGPLHAPMGPSLRPMGPLHTPRLYYAPWDPSIRPMRPLHTPHGTPPCLNGNPSSDDVARPR